MPLLMAAQRRVSRSRTPSGSPHCAPSRKLAPISNGIRSLQVRTLEGSFALRLNRTLLGLQNGPGNMAGFIRSAQIYLDFQVAVVYLSSQLKMGPGRAIVLTDAAAVKELMDKRSGSTVDRPPMHVADLVAGGLNMVSISALSIETLKLSSLTCF